MTTIRLSPEQERRLEQVAARENSSKSEIIKKALDTYLEEYFDSKSPYELGEDLFGKYGSGSSNLSRDYKNILKERLREKHAH